MYYLYGMRMRPAMPGAQPKGCEIVTEQFCNMFCGRKYHDIIAYQWRLTEEEVTSYELDYLVATEDINI